MTKRVIHFVFVFLMDGPYYENQCFKRLFSTQGSIICVPASCLSWVPEKGTVGASGDLAPLAHLTLGLMGEGRMWSPQSGWADAKAVSFFTVLHYEGQEIFVVQLSNTTNDTRQMDFS